MPSLEDAEARGMPFQAHCRLAVKSDRTALHRLVCAGNNRRLPGAVTPFGANSSHSAGPTDAVMAQMPAGAFADKPGPGGKESFGSSLHGAFQCSATCWARVCFARRLTGLLRFGHQPRLPAMRPKPGFFHGAMLDTAQSLLFYTIQGASPGFDCLYSYGFNSNFMCNPDRWHW